MKVVREKRKVLQNQARKLQNELVTSRQRREQLTEKGKQLKEGLGELEMESRMLEEQIKKETKQKEDLVGN